MDFEKNYHLCLEKLKWVTNQLEVEVPSTELTKIAKLIVQTMTGTWRYFHSTEHIFAVGGFTDAIEVLAALFHDIVYVQIDGSVNFNLTYYLTPIIEENNGQLLIREKNESQCDRIFEIVAAVFGFVPGQVLSPFAGQNEFLSAVVAAKVLEPFLSAGIITEIAACIEATIPFRAKSESGLNPSEILHQRLQTINHQFNLQMTDDEIIQTVQRAVRVANRDVVGFADLSSAAFLDNTWSLLPETNHNLQKSGSYTVRDYRIAIHKMAGFLNFLTPGLIFRQFQGEPDDQTYHKLVQRAGRNLAVGQLYLESKVVAIAILEALSLRIGSDVSLTILLGELPGSGVSVGRLRDCLPELHTPRKAETDIERDVLDLLEKGRTKSSAYDLKVSPLTTFMVRYLGFDEIREMWKRSQEFFQGAMSSEDFLASCNPDIIRIIANGAIELLENRKIALARPCQPLHSDWKIRQKAEGGGQKE